MEDSVPVPDSSPNPLDKPPVYYSLIFDTTDIVYVTDELPVYSKSVTETEGEEKSCLKSCGECIAILLIFVYMLFSVFLLVFGCYVSGVHSEIFITIGIFFLFFIKILNLSLVKNEIKLGTCLILIFMSEIALLISDWGHFSIFVSS